MTINLSEEEKASLLEQHRGILVHMANKFSWLDEFDDMMGWAYLGFASVINLYEEEEVKETAIGSYLFGEIKKVIVSHYLRNTSNIKEASLNQPVGEKEDGELQNLLEKNELYYNYSHIEQMVNQALFECDPVEKEIIMKYLLQNYKEKKLQMSYGVKSTEFNKITRQGIALIKLHLSNNDIISDNLLYPIVRGEKSRKPIATLSDETYRRIKYIHKNYTFMTVNGISILLDCEPFAIQTILDYPTTSYIRCIPDDSIKDSVEAYCEKHYSEYLPGEVTVYYKAV